MSRVSKGISYLLRESDYKEGEQQRNSNSVGSSLDFMLVPNTQPDLYILPTKQLLQDVKGQVGDLQYVQVSELHLVYTLG